MAAALLTLTLFLAGIPLSLNLSPFALECVGSEAGSEIGDSKREDDKEIHILAFVPCSQPGDGQFEVCCWVGDIPILAMALDQINLDSNLLPGYRLVLDFVKSGCSNAAVSTVTLHDSVVKALQGDGPVHHMILGPACTMATEPVAELSGKYLNINQVSYTASGIQFQDRERFSRLYTLQPLIFSYNDAYLSIIRRFNWTRVAVINEVNDLYSAPAIDLRNKLEEADIRVEHYGSFEGDPEKELQMIKKLDIRIIIALFVPNTPLARTLWCEAVKLGLVSDRHVWFTPVWATLNLSENVSNSCTNEQLMEALSGNFGVLGSDLVLDRRESQTKLVSGQSPAEFYDQLECYKKAFSKKYPHIDPDKAVDEGINFKMGYVYDSIWAIALALNQTIQQGIPLERFTYKDVELADLMEEGLRNSNFLGISGNVSFTVNGSNETGFRTDPYLELWQYNEAGQLELRLIYSSGDEKFIRKTSTSLLPDGPPSDGPTPTIIHYPLWAVVTVSITSGTGMVCAFACLVVTLAYRKHRAFKKSTFRLNAIICIGIFLGFLGDFIIAFSFRFAQQNISTMDVIVNMGSWLYHISFVLAFASLLMKTWRIYRIFCNAELRKRKYLDDKYLMLAVGAMVTFNVVVLIAWTCVAPWKWEKNEYVNPANPPETLVIYYIKDNDLIVTFVAVHLAAYALLLLLGMFMACQIKRNIRSFYSRYNESVIVNLSSLLALTISFGSVIVYLILTPKAEAAAGLALLLTIVRDGSWMFPMLGLMYMPMIFELVREKYTGRRIIRQRSTLYSRWMYSETASRLYHRFSSASLFSNSMDETHRRISLAGASPPPSSHPFSSAGEGSRSVTARPLTSLREVEAECIPGESTQRKTSENVIRTSSNVSEGSSPQHHLPQSRKRSILKISPHAGTINSTEKNDDKRGPHHVQFTEF